MVREGFPANRSSSELREGLYASRVAEVAVIVPETIDRAAIGYLPDVDVSRAHQRLCEHKDRQRTVCLDAGAVIGRDAMEQRQGGIAVRAARGAETNAAIAGGGTVGRSGIDLVFPARGVHAD